MSEVSKYMRLASEDAGCRQAFLRLAFLAQQTRIAELEAELAAERTKTSRLLRQIRDRELEDTGLYDWNGEPLE